jgi:hypothetical protein
MNAGHASPEEPPAGLEPATFALQKQTRLHAAIGLKAGKHGNNSGYRVQASALPSLDPHAKAVISTPKRSENGHPAPATVANSRRLFI